MTTTRNRDAIQVTMGAKNPGAIASAIWSAAMEMRPAPGQGSDEQVCKDPAVRLMVYQLADICGVTNLPPSEFSKLYDATSDAAAAELKACA